jgi:hypothetical protein
MRFNLSNQICKASRFWDRLTILDCRFGPSRQPSYCTGNGGFRCFTAAIGAGRIGNSDTPNVTCPVKNAHVKRHIICPSSIGFFGDVPGNAWRQFSVPWNNDTDAGPMWMSADIVFFAVLDGPAFPFEAPQNFPGIGL